MDSNLHDSKTPDGQPSYPGLGTLDDPYIVSFAERDPSNPRDWSTARKWMRVFPFRSPLLNAQAEFPLCRYTVASNVALLCISVSATIYASGVDQIVDAFGVGIEVATLGVSVYQLGFAFGPLCWVRPLPRPSYIPLNPPCVGPAIRTLRQTTRLPLLVFDFYVVHARNGARARYHRDARLSVLGGCGGIQYSRHISRHYRGCTLVAHPGESQNRAESSP